MTAIGGTAYLKIDGETKTLGGSWNVSPTTTVKTGVTGLSGYAGYTEAPRMPFMEGTLIDSGGLKVKDLEKITNATITVELVNGKTFVGQEMFLAGEPQQDAATGEVTGVRFEGRNIDEMES